MELEALDVGETEEDILLEAAQTIALQRDGLDTVTQISWICLDCYADSKDQLDQPNSIADPGEARCCSTNTTVTK